MSNGFKGWGSIFAILGGLLFLFYLFSGSEQLLLSAISGVVVGITFFVCAGFCKILEDTRDTLNRIEKILENQTKTEE